MMTNLIIIIFTFSNINFRFKDFEAAISIIDPKIQYNGDYQQISYPGGDVDTKIGVCTDVVIRTLRNLV